MKISFPCIKVDAIKSLLREQWPVTRRQAKVREVLSMAGKLWNLTYVVRAGKYFVWRLLRLTGLHDSRGSNNQNNTVELGREFLADLFWKWAIDNELLLEGEGLSAPATRRSEDPSKDTTNPTPVLRLWADSALRRRYFGGLTYREN